MPSVRKSEENKDIVAAVQAAFDADVDIHAYWDEKEENSVGIMTAVDRPTTGFASYATVGLSDYPIFDGKRKLPVRVELLGMAGKRVKTFPNILATAAFNVINSKWMVAPEVIFPDVVKMYSASKTMRHLLFADPFPSEGKLETLHFKSKTVAWLLAVPISEAEHKYAEKHGACKLNDLLVEHEVEFFDIKRKSVV